jgi:hypothetical protein
MYKKFFPAALLFLINIVFSFSQSANLDSAYFYLNNGNTARATQIFEQYVQENPSNTKIRMQLGYIYYSQNKLDKSLKNFDYVGRHSSDPADVETSRSSAYIIRDQLAIVAKRSLDMYFYNYYDSFQENYIADITLHYNFRMAPKFYTGLYLDAYTDSRSKPGNIYNDRFLEIGGFLRYNILSNLFLEFRVGYAREIDLDKSDFNIKPLLVYFARFGEAKIYVGKKAASTTSLFLDLYYAAMYDYKFRNAFVQTAFNEVMRFHTGGYSYIESYLVQYAQFDSRKYDYNNYAEVGTGLRFKPNLAIFPVLFVEPTFKVYFF